MNDKTGIRDNKGCVSSEVHLSFVCPGHMGDLDLPFLRLLVAIILFCSFECPVDAQPAGWKLLHLSKATVNYPANWEAQGSVCELLNSSLPIKLYAIDGGANLYLFFLTCRRYIRVADPALERDEMAILNSIAFDKYQREKYGTI